MSTGGVSLDVVRSYVRQQTRPA
nr:hypothetical protein [Marinobacter gelidimuriae]